MAKVLLERSVRTHLFFIFLGTAIPLFALLGTAVFYVSRAEFDSTKRGLQATARALSAAIDRELRSSIATLEAVGTAKFVDQGNLRELHQSVINILPTQPGWRTVIIHDPTRKNLFHSSFPFGTPRPGVTEVKSFDEVIRTLRPTVMNYFRGPVSGPTVGVRVPVLRDGKLRYVLSATIDAARLDQVLQEQQLPAGWYAVVFDKEHVQIASSSKNSESIRGNKTGLISQFPDNVNSAWISGPDREGIESYGAFVKAPLSGYYVGIILPQSELTKNLLNSVWIVSTVGVLTIAAGLFLILFYGRLLRRCTGYLVETAYRIGEGRAVEVLSTTPVTEVNLISRAMAEASALLQRTKKERDQADAARDSFEASLRKARDDLSRRNAELKIVTDSMPVGVARLDKIQRYLWVSKQYGEWLGKPSSELVGRTIAEVLGADLYAVIQLRIDAVLSGQTVEFEAQIQMSDRGRRWVHATYSPTYASDGTVDGWVAVIIDIDERRRAEETLENMARLPLEDPAPVLRVNSVGGVIFSNPAAQKTLTELGRATSEPLPDALFEAVSNALDDNRRRELEVPVGARLFLFLVVPIAERRYANLYGIDITERKAAEAALTEADRRKDNFLAVLAHELRNPLAPIRNAIELLKRPNLTAENFQLARDIAERQLEQMVRLIDDLLDISRISQGKIELKKERVTLKSIVDQALETSRPHIEENGHQLRVILPKERIVLHADRVRLAQVVSNLINNACKYSEKNGNLVIIARMENGKDLLLSVKDNGIGISPEDLPTVFEMFSQVSSSNEHSQGGLGIGLSLVKALVELHGGSVQARSEGLGKGSEFIVHLPVLETDGSEGESGFDTGPESWGEALAKQRVLIVDDNVPQAQTLALLLQTMGFEVRAAYDAQSALRLLDEFTPDTALVDIGLPGMNGYDLARQIRANDKKIVLVAQTGWARDEDRERGKQAGFDFHLTKPINYQLLEQILLYSQSRP